MISFSNKFVYHHIPKCGGTSIEAALSDYWPEKHRTSIKKMNKWRTGEIWTINFQHALPEEILNYFPETKDFKSFTTIRNPWARMVSYFYHLKRLVRIKDDITFDDFIEIILNESKTRARYEVGHFGNAHCPADFIQPYTKWFSQKEPDMYVKLEGLNKGFGLVCDYMDIENTSLPHLNKTDHKHYSTYYTNRPLEMVGDMFEEDILKFNYSFEKHA